MAYFRNNTVSTTGVNIKTTGANVTSINIINRHSAVIYVRFYNQTVATFQDTPFKTLTVPANGGSYSDLSNGKVKFGSTNGLCVRVSTGVTDQDNTAAGTLPIMELEYE